jgi:hypothetical protein
MGFRWYWKCTLSDLYHFGTTLAARIAAQGRIISTGCARAYTRVEFRTGNSDTTGWRRDGMREGHGIEGSIADLCQRQKLTGREKERERRRTTKGKGLIFEKEKRTPPLIQALCMYNLLPYHTILSTPFSVTS